MSFFENTRKPLGVGGKVMIDMMNFGHNALSDWGLQFLSPNADAAVLDCGCGGGAVLKKLLKKCPEGHISGIDYSSVSVEKSKTLNKKAMESGRCEVIQASVAELPFQEAVFDLATAFETVYFWPELPQSFREVHRVLKPGGQFLICNECGGENDKDNKWTDRIEGMTIYKDVELKTVLEQSGFYNIRTYKNKKGWLCLIAQK